MNLTDFFPALAIYRFPYTEDETVPSWLLVVLCGGVPIVAIFLVAIVFVPGGTVPKNTPWALVWKRKLWELHVGWLGLLMALASSFFFISGIKNMCGKPRPDLLSRCQPDLENAAKYLIGGLTGDTKLNAPPIGLLYSASICTQTDSKKLHDGFRSYPSGHAGASAAGLIYLSLFLASKFSITLPYVPASNGSDGHVVHAAFPSRMQSASDSYDDSSSPMTAKAANSSARQNSKLQALRGQAAAPPVYLLAITLTPFCVAIFIAASRWFDFRHHGFDILFGFLIGIITAIYSFKYYHLPIRQGAGWAWGPRSDERAFWAGVGRLGYAGDKTDSVTPRYDAHADLGESGDVHAYPSHGGALSQRNGTLRSEQFQDVEMNRMDGRAPPRVDPAALNSRI